MSQADTAKVAYDVRTDTAARPTRGTRSRELLGTDLVGVAYSPGTAGWALAPLAA
jgi:hypothetical protein